MRHWALIISLTCFLSTWGHAFDGPKVIKLDWNTRSLVKADFYGDSRLDMAVINNHTSRIEVLLQNAPGEPLPLPRKQISRKSWEPILEDAALVKKSIAIGDSGYALAAGDLNGDGLVDLAYTGQHHSITVLYQGPDFSWHERWQDDAFKAQSSSKSLQVVDIDDDGDNDMVVLADSALYIYLQDESHELTEPQVYHTSGLKHNELAIADFNGDGTQDIRYLSGLNHERSMVFRFQYAFGFGPESHYPLDSGAIGFEAYQAPGLSHPSYVFIDGLTRQIRHVGLDSSKGYAERLDELRRDAYSLPDEISGNYVHLLHDVDSDGLTDIMIAGGKGASLYLYRQNKSGLFESPTSFPVYRQLESISHLSWPKTGSENYLLVSKKEGLVGMSTYDAEAARLTYPHRLDVAAHVVAGTSLPLQHEDNPLIALLFKDKKDYVLRLYALAENGHVDLLAEQTLGLLKRDPVYFAPHSLNVEAGQQLLVVQPNENSILINLKKADGSGAPWTLESQRFKQMKRADFSFYDFDKDGDEEILLASTGVLRAYTFDSELESQVLEQINGSNSASELKIPAFIRFPNEAEALPFYYSSMEKQLELCRKDEVHVFRVVQQLLFDDLNPLTMDYVVDGGFSRPLIFGSKKFYLLDVNQPPYGFDEYSDRYETDIEGMHYTEILAGDLLGDEAYELILVDGYNHALDILGRKEGKRFESLIHFKVFEEDIHYSGRRGNTLEPREILIGDFNGDSINDIALLVHDRLLLYLGESESH